MYFEVDGFKVGVSVTKYKNGKEIFTKPYDELTKEEKKEFNYKATLNMAKAMYEDEEHEVRLVRE